MSKILKLNDTEIQTVRLLMAVLLNHYKTNLVDILCSGEAGKISEETSIVIQKLNLFDSCQIHVDENLIDELISNKVTNKENAKKFYESHTQDKRLGSGSITLTDY